MTTKKETEIVIDEETEANVTETISSDGKKTKRINYPAKIKENEVIENDEMAEIQDESFFSETDNLNANLENEEIPKDKLDIMFDDIERVSNGVNGIYFAKVTRQPDSLSDNFFNRCGGEMPLGVFQFSLRDRFNFIPQLQKINGNSGGYFNILVFDGQQKPLGWSYRIGYSRETGFKQIGCHNLLVPNPNITSDLTTTNQNQSNNTSLEMVFSKMAEMMQSNHNQLMQIINRQPEKSTLEKAIEQKMLNDLLNPPPPQTTNQFEQTMATILAAPVMIEKMSSRMFPPPPVEKEPNLAEQIQSGVKQALEIEPINNLFNIGVNALGMYAENKLTANTQSVIDNLPNQNPQQNPQPVAIAETENDMNYLIKDIIEELESDNILDENNELLQDLDKDYPSQSLMIKSLCKSNNFDVVLNLLMSQADGIKPVNPFVEFLDVEKSQTENRIVWNERGEKLLKRLNEFYEFAKK